MLLRVLVCLFYKDANFYEENGSAKSKHQTWQKLAQAPFTASTPLPGILVTLSAVKTSKSREVR